MGKAGNCYVAPEPPKAPGLLCTNSLLILLLIISFDDKGSLQKTISLDMILLYYPVVWLPV